jgi:hypothetical protein
LFCGGLETGPPEPDWNVGIGAAPQGGIAAGSCLTLSSRHIRIPEEERYRNLIFISFTHNHAHRAAPPRLTWFWFIEASSSPRALATAPSSRSSVASFWKSGSSSSPPSSWSISVEDHEERPMVCIDEMSEPGLSFVTREVDWTLYSPP